MGKQSFFGLKSMLNDLIFLYGPPGSGKTTSGQLLAENLGLPFLDLDGEIENTCNKSIPELFSSQGEAGFRNCERGILKSLLAAQPGVMALGGGALLDEDSRLLVESCGSVVCLSASLLVLLKRLRAAAPNRPLLAGDLEIQLANLLECRSAHYASFPLKTENDAASLEKTVWQIQVLLGRFHVRGMGAGYDVRISPGALDDLGAALPQRALCSGVVLVSDEQVALLYGKRVLGSLAAAR